MLSRRTLLGWLASLPALSRPRGRPSAPRIDARPTVFFAQPDGLNNLVRIQVTGLDAPAARARVVDRRGAPVGTAGLIPAEGGGFLAGEVWVPLAGPTQVRIEVEVSRRRVANATVRLAPPRRWTLHWLSTMHTDLGYTDLQERAVAVHLLNLDAALERAAAGSAHRWTPECAYQVLEYLDQRPATRGDALIAAIKEGRVGFQALFANVLTGLCDHETFNRLVAPAARLARDRGFQYRCALITDVPGQVPTFPTLLAASGVRYLASGPNAERAAPLLPPEEIQMLPGGVPTVLPQVSWWEGPDGSRVLHWRNRHYGDARRFGFDRGPEEMARRLEHWLVTSPRFQGADYPYDLALLYGAGYDNERFDEAMIANVEEFNRRFAFPRIVPGRAEEFFQELERRWGTRIPVIRGDTGQYWEDGAASTAAELAEFRAAQLAARAAEALGVWDIRLAGVIRDENFAAEVRVRAAERRAMWRDLLLFAEHTWGAAGSVDQPTARQTAMQWAYKKRFLTGGASAAWAQVHAGLLRLGRQTLEGTGRLIFNAGPWPRADLATVPGAAGSRFRLGDREVPSIDLPDGSALLAVPEVPALGYLALSETPGAAPRPVESDGDALEAAAGGWQVALDPATGAIRSCRNPDGAELVKPSPWSGWQQLLLVTGGEHSRLWTSWDRQDLAQEPQLDIRQATMQRARRERLPGIGVRLVCERLLGDDMAVESTVTLYDGFPWVDLETVVGKPARTVKEALYVAFPFALTAPTVEVEVPDGRMTVERDQQPGACRDWYCHQHWVWLRDGRGGICWSGPDTPLFTLNDIFRGQWRRSIAPDGTLFAYAMNNYWHTNYAAAQGGRFRMRFRVSALAPGDAAEPVRRGWAACDPLYASARFENTRSGALLPRDYALLVADKGVAAIGVKPADDGDGVILRLLDVTGTGRSAGVWAAVHGFRAARRTSLVEENGDALPLASDGHAVVPVAPWGVTTVRLFTPAP